MKTCGCILKQLQEASTDIIIVSNEFLFKNDIIAEIDKKLTRGCNIVDVTNLKPKNATQRMVYGLLEKKSFKPCSDDREAFRELSKYSLGSATLVHILTSLIQKYASVIAVAAILNVNSTTSNHQILYTRVNFILKNSAFFSSTALSLLCRLSIIGPIPIPKFYIDKLEEAFVNSDRRILSSHVSGQLLDQLQQGGVLRNFPHPLVYHKDFNPKSVDPTIHLLYIPKLICDAIDSEMDSTSKADSITFVQHTIETILTGKSTLSMIHLHYLLVLCNQLFDVCVSEQSTLGDVFVVESLKLKSIVEQHSQSGII